MNTITTPDGAVLKAVEPVHQLSMPIIPNRKQIRDYRRSLRQRCDANKVRKG